jgi:putative SOS response-associated peptidase YedK
VTNVRNTKSGHWRPWLASSSVVVGKDQNKGGRCIVPASAFAEPDRNTASPVINRWFVRADGVPFFFAGIWREWQGDRGTKKEPNVRAQRRCRADPQQSHAGDADDGGRRRALADRHAR